MDLQELMAFQERPLQIVQMVDGRQIKWVIQQLTTKASLIMFVLCNPFEH